jgi:hypothetical protein
MEILDAQDLFAQLARTPGSGGVKTIIENHDAWTHADSVYARLDRTLRTRLEQCSDALRKARIDHQRHTLAPLVTRLSSRSAAAC